MVNLSPKKIYDTRIAEIISIGPIIAEVEASIFLREKLYNSVGKIVQKNAKNKLIIIPILDIFRISFLIKLMGMKIKTIVISDENNSIKFDFF